MIASSNPPGLRCVWILVVLIVLLGAGIRLVSIERMPLFYDEAIHINNAHLISEGQFFAGLDESKWLYSAFMGIFRPMGPEGVWIARTLSGLLGALTVAACVALGRELGDWRVGMCAGLFYALLPMAVFHERQALVEPMVASLTALSTVLMVRLARKPRVWLAVLLGVVLAAAYMTKMLALPYLALPIAAAILLAGWGQPFRRALVLNALAVILALAVIVLIYRVAEQYGTAPGTRFSPAIGNTVLGGSGGLDIVTRLQDDSRVLWDILQSYVGWGVVLLVVLAGVWVVLGEGRREILFLAIPAFAFGIVPLLARRTTSGDILAPRYLLTNTASLIVLSSLSLSIVLKKLAATGHNIIRDAVGIVWVVAAVAPMLWFDGILIHDPWQAHLTEIDRDVQYHMAFNQGDLLEVRDELLEAWRAGDGRPINVLGFGLEVPLLEAHLGPRVANVTTPEQIAGEDTLAEWLAHESPVFFFGGENIAGQDIQRDVPDGADLTLAGSYDVLTGTLDLYRITGASGTLADAVCTRLAPAPEDMTNDYVLLAESLAESSPVLVFPPGHAPALAQYTVSDVIPFPAGSWPLDAGVMETTVTGLIPGDAGEVVEVILVDEAHVDPERMLALALQRRLYRVDDAWFGYLHRLSYVTGPSEPEMPSIRVLYEGVIELASGSILEPEAVPGGAVRIALTWRSPVEVQDSFRVFVHIVDADGALWVQRDAIPGDGLLPMPSWQPGEAVVDRFAIRLPPDMPPGAYEVRIGLYYPESGIRLAATAGPMIGPDYVVLGELIIPSP